MRVLSFRGFRKSIPRCALALVLSLLILSSGAILGITMSICQSQTELLNSSSKFERNKQWFVVTIVFAGIIVILHDGVIVWRAWILVNRAGRIFLGFCFLGIIVGVVNVLIRSIVINALQKPALFALQVAMLITNVVATLMIAGKLWSYRNNVSRFLHAPEKSFSEKVMILLVESGVVFIIFWIVAQMAFQGVFDHSNVPVSSIFIYIIIFFIGIHPSLIILISQQQSGLDVICNRINQSNLRFSPNESGTILSVSISTVTEQETGSTCTAMHDEEMAIEFDKGFAEHAELGRSQ
ncbi:hypothetical protein VKT23_013423 [Stygiomarasmius scandens]